MNLSTPLKTVRSGVWIPLLIFVTACEGTTEPLPVASVSVTPTRAELASGAALPISVQVTSSSGRPLTDRAVTWQSSDPAVAVVSSTGQVAGQMNRQANRASVTITATVEGLSAQALIEVLPVPVHSVRIDSDQTAMNGGAALQLTAVPLGADGEPVMGRPVTWSSSDPSLATISSDGIVTANFATTAEPDSVTITASAEAVTGSFRLAITPTPILRIQLSTDSVMVGLGDSITLEARALAAGDVALPGQPILWTSQDTSIVRISNQGVVTIVDDGGSRFRTTSVVAQLGSLADTAKVVAQPPSPSVRLTSLEDWVRVGSSTQLSWQSDRAYTCTGTNRLPTELDPSGAYAYSPADGGRHWVRIACTGDGGIAADSTLVVTPFPVLPSGYENYRAYVVPPIESPFHQVPECYLNGRGVANARVYADVRQDGTLLLVDHMEGYVCFWERTPEGEWVVVNDQIIDDAHVPTCPNDAYKGIVVDFNGNDRPDFLFLCYRQESFVLLSDDEGKYTSRSLGFTAWTHSGSAGDITGNGHPDILIANDQWEVRGHRPEGEDVFQPAPGELDAYITVLVNDGRGNFTRRDDLITIPDSLANWHMRHNPSQASDYRFGMESFGTIELMDLDGDGALDAVIAGGNYPTTIFWGDLRGGFSRHRSPTKIPWVLPPLRFNGTHTFHHVGDYLYSWSIWNQDGLGNFMERTNLQTWESEIIWTRFEGYACDCPAGGIWRSIGRIQFHNGKFVSDWVLGLEIDP